MSSKIYDEAIAEAKKLREVAEQNAKNAIIEAVTPRIREFIDQQLMEKDPKDLGSDTSGDFSESLISESLGLEASDELSSVILDSSAIEKLTEILGSSPGDIDVKEAIEQSISSLLTDDADLVRSAVEKLNNNEDNFDNKQINKNVAHLQENSNMKSDETVYEVDLDLLRESVEADDADDGTINLEGMFSDTEDDSEIDLSEILAELDGLDLVNEDKIEVDFGDVELPDDVQLVARLIADDEDEDSEADLEVDEEEDADEDLPLDDFEDDEDLEDLDEVLNIDPEMLKREIEMLRSNINEAGDLSQAKGGCPDNKETAFGGKGSGKKGDDFGGGTRKGDPLKLKFKVLKEELKKEKRVNRSLGKKLNEYVSAVETLREQLTDLNLFNAKLLYVNKLLQDKGISSSRKRSMVESIDAAKSLREVKLIYKTLTEISSNSSKKSLSESTARSIGSSSRATGRASSTSANGEVDRWALLAGLKQ
tara:strand:+ start:90265 stop:91704 length:1440 start_codon:yes stop_codon:yes gene_type:complete